MAKARYNLNPVSALGKELRHVDFPKLPGKPKAIDGKVVIAGSKRKRKPRYGPIPASKI